MFKLGLAARNVGPLVAWNAMQQEANMHQHFRAVKTQLRLAKNHSTPAVIAAQREAFIAQSACDEALALLDRL